MGFSGRRRLSKIKMKIQKMNNSNLISEWQTIRYVNSFCSPTEASQCQMCSLTKCFGHLTYEEIITNELIDRGLFDFALSKSFCNKIPIL